MNTNDLHEQMRKALNDAGTIADRATAENRDFTAEERVAIEGYMKEAGDLKAKIKSANSDNDLRNQLAGLGADLPQAATPQKKSNGPGAPAGNGQTIGERFVNAAAYQQWYKSVAPNGLIPESRKGLSSPSVDVGHFGMFRKDLITGSSATSAGAWIIPDQSGIYEPLGRYPLNLRSLISVRTTMSDSVEFVRQTTQVTQAAPVPEANVTTYTGATGQVQGLKPEGSTTFERVNEPVKTIAVWIPATKRALSDAAQLRGLIDQELREDLAEELENQLLNGDGSGENFTGLANTANTLSQAFTTDIITTTRKAITYLKTAGKTRPTAWLMHPQDWETIDLLKDDQGRYYWGGPMSQGAQVLHGIPVVESFFVTPGAAWLANWSKAVLWDREQATITTTDSHSDFFIRNMVAILAEMRAAFGVIRPSAFCEVDLYGGS
jgi:HK97 family phage major capsid protein